jgi:hypothetical protein
VAFGLYDKAREKFLTGALNWTSGTWKVVLIDEADYTVNLSTHATMETATVPAAARVGTPQTLAGQTATNGTADANDVAFPTVTGDQCEALLIYKFGTSETSADSYPVVYMGSDTPGMTGLPVTPNGGNINITWNASGIFRL